MKKPPIPDFVAAYPEPKSKSFLIIAFIVLSVAAISFYFYSKEQKNKDV